MSKENTKILNEIFEQLRQIDYIKPEDIPNIDLYMDQVTTFMDEHLKSMKRYDDDKMLTKTMINNYTKNNLIPTSEKKKYSKEHIMLLIFIYYFKSILSISDVQSILEPLTDTYYDGNKGLKLEDIYQEVFRLSNAQMELMTKDLLQKYSTAEATFEDEEDEEDKEFLTTFSFICMLSFDVYLKKRIIENIVDAKRNSGKMKNQKQDSESKRSKQEKAKNDAAKQKKASRK